MAAIEFSTMTDEALALLAEKDRHAQEFLLQKYKPLVRVKAGAYFLVGADREDLVQEGMLGLFKAIRDFNSEKSNFYAFAELCITRQIISAIKAATRQKHVPLNSAVSLQSTHSQTTLSLEQMLAPRESNDPQEILLQRQQMDTMQEAMQQMLSPLEKEVLMLYLRGLTYVEIAQSLKRSEKSVDNALQRVKNKLEEFLR
jgi:RNA polymerase sporulation-specific sigma factor